MHIFALVINPGSLPGDFGFIVCSIICIGLRVILKKSGLPRARSLVTVTRESQDEMSQMFTENVCMDFDQLILALVQLLMTDALIGRLQISA
jgi:hypothetical protein